MTWERPGIEPGDSTHLGRPKPADCPLLVVAGLSPSGHSKYQSLEIVFNISNRNKSSSDSCITGITSDCKTV